jgi:DNA-binding response OmpR family regulator
MPHLLLLEDHDTSRVNLAQNLVREGFSVSAFATGTEALAYLTAASRGETTLPEVAVLDRSLPDMDGLEVMKWIRGQAALKGIPILMVTARTEEIERVLGLELGADDYVSKPFSFRELLARIHAIARRCAPLSPGAAAQPQPTSPNTLCLGPLLVDLDRFTAEVGREPVALTRREFELLVYFLKHPGQVLTRKHLVNQVWKQPSAQENRTVDVHVTRLRTKLKPALDGLQTVIGVGYRLD